MTDKEYARHPLKLCSCGHLHEQHEYRVDYILKAVVRERCPGCKCKKFEAKAEELK